jgi:2,3-bisphosphoglycerate-dependent phosphoglycerate mutase
MHKVVLLRHGQSEWNLANKFTGWTDVGLTELGVEEARKAGERLLEDGFAFDIIFTSVLKRATLTTEIVQGQMGLQSVQVEKTWRLNERHYGALQGLNKSEMAAKYGEEQVKTWRRSYDTRPPALERSDERYLAVAKDPRYAGLKPEEIPTTECLKDCVARVRPYWEKVILPAVLAGKSVLVSASGNSLRAVVKIVEDMPDSEIVEFNMPTGIPMVYELDDSGKPLKRYFLASAEELDSALNKVKNQGKAAKAQENC